MDAKSDNKYEKLDVRLSYYNENLTPHIKILHFADQQIEVVPNRHDRYDEYKYTNLQIAAAADKHKPDLIVIAGDIYQNGNRGTINSNEEALFGHQLRKLLAAVDCDIIIINGNHDMQKSSNIPRLFTEGEVTAPYDEIENVVDFINSPRLKYWKFTGKYPHIVNGVTYNFIVHSHYNKQLVFLDEYIYSEPTNPNEPNVALYHDSTMNYSIGFNSQIIEEAKNVTIDAFDNVNCVIAGDIHMPQIHEIGTTPHGNPKIFGYASSITMRDSGEGDYYKNDWCYQRGSSYHGYMVWELNDLGEAVKCDFHPIAPCVTFATVKMDKMFDALPLPIPAHVKIISSLSAADTVIMKQRIEENPNCLSVSMEGNYTVTFSEETEEAVLKTDFSKDELLEESLQFVDRVVDTSRGVIDKDGTKEILRGLVSQSFQSILLSKPKKVLRFVSVDVENFLGVRSASIPLDKDLTKISGTNGAGKSTCAKALIWCNCGKITGREKKTSKIRNLNVLKNRLNDDPLKVTTRSILNGDQYEVTRMVDFSGKKPVETITIFLNGEEQSPTDPQEYLDERFPFEEIRNIYQNIASLDLFLHQPSDKLRTEILKRVGIGAIELLDENFNQIKLDYMSQFPKPDNKKKHYESRITEAQSTIKEMGSDIEQNNQSLLEISKQNCEYDEKLSEYNEYLYEQEESLDKEATQAYFSMEGEIKNLKSELTKVNEKIEEYGGEGGFNREKLDEYSNEVDTLGEQIQQLKLTINIDRGKLKEATKNRTYWKEEGLKRKQEISAEEHEVYKKIFININKEILKLNEQIESLKKEVIESKEGYDLLKSDFKKLEEKATSLQTSIQNGMYDLALTMKSDFNSGLEEDIHTLMVEQSNSEKELDKLKSTKTEISLELKSKENEVEMHKNNLCQNCGEPHGIKSCDLDSIVSKINSLKIKFDGITDEIDNFAIIDNSNTIKEKRDTIKLVNDSIRSKDYTKLEEIFGKEIMSPEIKELGEELYSVQTEGASLGCVIDTYDLIDHSDKIKELVQKKVSKETQAENINVEDNIKNACAQDEAILSIREKYVDADTEVRELEEKIENNEKTLDNNEQRLISVRKLHLEEEKKANLWLSKGDQKTMQENRKTELLKSIKESEKEFESLQIRYNNNKHIEETIKKARASIKELNDVLSANEKQQIELNHNNEKFEIRIVEQEKEIERCKDFIKQLDCLSMANKTMNLFKKIVSGNGLPLYVFNQIANIINQRLADKLDKFPFALRFEQGDLVKIDKRNGKVIDMPVEHISGMEINMGALALMEVIDSLNDEWNIDLRFIDELSGQLNSGKDLKNREALDFRDLYKNLLIDISQTKKLIVVDHVLKGIGDPVIEFIMGDYGGYHV
jgi:DNA repair exonuclease SbcCD nuclease subunit/DNA repair exonuclease SbcCD ATPase subunit